MLPTQRFDTDDDRGVSPVIGVILMVAITVILAAVIASFVLGLGGNNEPAPSPTVDSSVGDGNITLDVTGGDDFDASVATVQGTVNGNDVEFAMDNDDANLDEVTAGTTIRINTSKAFINEQEITSGNAGGSAVDNSGVTNLVSIDEWELEIVWNPADQDSQIIFSDSSD